MTTTITGLKTGSRYVSQSEDLDYALRALRLIAHDPQRRAVRVPDTLAYHVASFDSLTFDPHNIAIRESVHRAILAEHLPRCVVTAGFEVAARLFRPVGVRLGKAREVRGHAV